MKTKKQYITETTKDKSREQWDKSKSEKITAKAKSVVFEKTQLIDWLPRREKTEISELKSGMALNPRDVERILRA